MLPLMNHIPRYKDRICQQVQIHICRSHDVLLHVPRNWSDKAGNSPLISSTLEDSVATTTDKLFWWIGLFIAFAVPPLRVGGVYIPTPLTSGLVMWLFGWWNVSRCYMNWSSKCVCMVRCGFLSFCHLDGPRTRGMWSRPETELEPQLEADPSWPIWWQTREK